MNHHIRKVRLDKFAPSLVQGEGKKLEKTRLGFGDFSGFTIAEVRDRELRDFLKVSLLEELLHYLVAPLAAYIKGTSRIADVGNFDGNLEREREREKCK